MLVLALVFAAVAAEAQTAVPKIPQGAILTVAVDHPTGAAATGYRFYVDQAQLGSDYAATAWDPTTQVATIKTPAITHGLGLHLLGLTAFNAGGETSPATLQIEVVPPPPPPLGPPTFFRIVGTILADGTIRWTMEPVPAAGQ